jgi:hypothetical protein
LNLILKPVLILVNDLYYLKFLLRSTLDEGPRGKVQQNGTILWVKSHKLDPRLLDEDPKPIQANLKWHLHGIILEGNSIGPNQQMKLNESSWFR